MLTHCEKEDFQENMLTALQASTAGCVRCVYSALLELCILVVGLRQFEVKLTRPQP